MRWPRGASISGRLTRLNLMVSGIALALAYLAFFSYDLVSYRNNLVRNLTAMARITAANSVSALTFEDPPSAQKTLDALRSFPDIRYAALLTTSGEILAQYPGAAEAPKEFPLSPLGKRTTIQGHGEHVLLIERVMSSGRAVGYLYLSADLRELGGRAWHFLLIAAIILVVCLLVALAVSRAFRRSLTWPLIELAGTARRVTRDRDYSVRAGPSGGYEEMEVLTAAFNEMLVEIQKRDRDLQAARDEMESRVDERTEELQRTNRELEAFSYTVAHDLRGPLDMMSSTSFLLEKLHSENLDRAGGEMVTRLRQSSREMAAIIDDLLNLSRASGAPIERDQVNLSGITRSIAEELRMLDSGRAVEFVIESNVIVSGSAGLLRIVMENLLRNSWKYTSRHAQARIEFGASRRDQERIFFVRDDGAGFDPRQAGRLFEPFQRLHSKLEFPGTGIGLATVQRVIARHGGRIWAEGAVDRGATISFTLPGASES